MSHPSRAVGNHPFDAVTLEILWRRTISAVDEAAKALRRTSFSTLVNESNDFACVLTDATGQSLAQAAAGGPPKEAVAGTQPTKPASATRADPVKGTRPVYFPEFREFRATTAYDRYALLPGAAFDGPAIVEERESTLVIGPGGRFQVTPSGNIIISVGVSRNAS